MSSHQALQEDQLLELLLQLKKTTPEQARAILNSQPQISYALMAVMVNLNAINVEVVQKTLTEVGAGPSGSATPTVVSSSSSTSPAFVPPPHPGSSAPPYPQGPPGVPAQPQNHPPTGPSYASQGSMYPPQGPAYPQGPPGYPAYPQQPPPPQQFHAPPQGPQYGAAPPSAPASMMTPALQAAVAAIPEDQRALIMRVVSMTPEEINQIPPQERSSILQLRATLGIST